MKMRILSLNVRCRSDGGNTITTRAHRLRKLIRDVSPDIAAFQECSLLWRLFIHLHYGREYHIYTARRGGILDEALVIMWKKGKFTCKGKGRFFLSDKPDDPKYPCYERRYNCRRITSYVKLSCDEYDFYAVNTHFGFEEPERIKSAELLCRYAKEKGFSPCIIAGDFNADESSQTYRIMSEHYSDADTEGRREPTYHGYGKEKKKRIDYIFTDEGFTVSDFCLEDERRYGYVSDHYTLYADTERK